MLIWGIQITFGDMRDDLLWKGILEDVFEDFLCFFQPNARTLFDLSRGVEFLDKELEQLFPPDGDLYQPKVIDKLAKVRTFLGEEKWVLIHVEVQGVYKKDFAQRMFAYFSRLYDKYQKPIAAFAILTEATRLKRIDRFELSFLGTILSYQFNLYKIAWQNEQLLLASDNPFALVVLTAKKAIDAQKIRSGNRDEVLLEIKMGLAKLLLSKKITKDKIRVLMDFLKYYVRFDAKENNIIFEQKLEILTGRSNTMGIEELLLDRAKKQGIEQGIDLGIEKGIEQVALEMKREGLSLDQIAKFTKLSNKEIEEL